MNPTADFDAWRHYVMHKLEQQEREIEGLKHKIVLQQREIEDLKHFVHTMVNRVNTIVLGREVKEIRKGKGG